VQRSILKFIVLYSESHSTNTNGLDSLSIGRGNVLSGSFQNINWSRGSFYRKTETDPIGGSNYTITSTQQLLSVLYASYAKTPGSSNLAKQNNYNVTKSNIAT
jgi:hypothetical protein